MYNGMKYIKPFGTLNENDGNVDETYIKTLNFNGEKLTLHKYAENPMKVIFYLDTMDGESYMDINTIIDTNLLVDAIWVKVGGDEEKIADSLDFLSKSKNTTASGYNKYVMYNIIN
jgi:fructose-1,6-bisphosphatase